MNAIKPIEGNDPLKLEPGENFRFFGIGPGKKSNKLGEVLTTTDEGDEQENNN